MAEKVAVVGLGPLGLMGMKNLKEAGFDVTGFESKPQVGGLWMPTPEPTISAHPTTTFNTSKYRAAVSDFPFPDDVDDFPTALQLRRYLEGYCDHFGLRPSVRLNTAVKGIKRVGSKWGLEIASKDGKASTEYFTKVAFATGSFSTPRVPELKGIELFQGDALHSIEYHDDTPYQGKNVLIVGLHATTQDVAMALGKTAAKVYISHRSGLLPFPRYIDGATFDQMGSLGFTFIQLFMMSWFPRLWDWIVDKLLGSMSKKAFPRIPKKWGFDPWPTVATTPPLVMSPDFYKVLDSGVAEPVPQVSRITGPHTVELVDGTVLPNIAAIIYCTGYNFAAPLAPEGFTVYPVRGEPPQLYHNIIPVSQDPAIRTSLAYLGQVGIPFPGFVQHELVGMCLAQIWRGSSPFPSYGQMQGWYRRHLRWWRGRKAISAKEGHGGGESFYEAWVEPPDHLSWMDKTAGTGLWQHFGWFQWRAWRFWWTDKKLYDVVKGGLFTPTIWRLFDMGRRKPWVGAREQIFKDNEMAKEQVRKKKEQDEKDNTHGNN